MKRLLRPDRSTALLTLVVTAVAIVVSGGRMFSPGGLSAENTSGENVGGVSAHVDLSGNCSACHVPFWSKATMASRCLDCHKDVQHQIDTSGPLHGKLANAKDCRGCHTEHLGPHGTITSLAKFDHNCAAFALTGKHLTLDCAACHKSKHYSGVAQTCAGCHDEPKVHFGKFGTECASCHSTSDWKDAFVSGSPSSQFDHDRTGFKLTGKHRTADCKSCHVNNVFKGTSQSCVACHHEPKVHLGKFGTECSSCHSTTNWKGAVVNLAVANVKFDHDLTAFKLTGKHRATDCKSCHVNSVFKGTSQSCVSCHVEPKVHLGKFGTECTTCHTTTTWKGAVVNLAANVKFDHDLTGFKLTGKHQGADCKSCHATGVFKGTSQSCVSCHAEPPSPLVHKARYGANCVQCHNTLSFKGTTFKHTFPINHHARGNKGMVVAGNICANCHNNAADLTTYTCYNCHVHEKSRMERVHARRKVVNLDQCAKCHKTGRGGRAELEGNERDVFLAWLYDGDAMPAFCSRPSEE